MINKIEVANKDNFYFFNQIVKFRETFQNMRIPQETRLLYLNMINTLKKSKYHQFKGVCFT